MSTNSGVARHGHGLASVGVVVALVAAMFAANVVATIMLMRDPPAGETKATWYSPADVGVRRG